MSDIKHLVDGVHGRWTTTELRVAELLRLGAAEKSVAVELGVHVKQITSLKKRKGFNDLLGLSVGPVAGYAEKWQDIRQRQLGLAGTALDTIEEAMFMARLEEIAVREAEAGAPQVLDVSGG